MKKAILPVIVATLFLTVAASSAIASERPILGETNKVLTVIVGDEEGMERQVIEVEESVMDSFVAELTAFKEYLEETRPFQDFKITEEEKAAISTKAENLIASLNTVLEDNGMEPVTFDWVMECLFDVDFGRSSIMSIGKGFAYIPFYDYETFIGVMLRPIFLWYPMWLGCGGYSGNMNINIFPPRIEFGDRLGSHMVRTLVFNGLYINFGDLGYDRMFGGWMLMLGRAIVGM